MTVTCDTMRTKWTDPKARPLFKGSLIDENGCCCAQGDVLRECGLSDKELRAMNQALADKEVAQTLGISLFHSVLLRKVNDSADGCPERVLLFTDDGLGKVLGPNWRSVIAFGEHMSAMTYEQWAAAGAAAWELVGWSKLTTEPYFLKFFGIVDAKAFVETAEKRWR